MTIFEIYFDNGEVYEDNDIIRNYYETIEEARAALNEFVYERWYSHEDATISINEYELGTQKRSQIETHKLCDIPSQKSFEEEERKRYLQKQEEMREERARRMNEESKNVGGLIPPIEKSTLGDIDVLRALRDKLAGL